MILSRSDGGDNYEVGSGMGIGMEMGVGTRMGMGTKMSIGMGARISIGKGMRRNKIKWDRNRMGWIENGGGQRIGVQWNEIMRQNVNTPHGNGIVLNESDKANTNTIKHEKTKQNTMTKRETRKSIRQETKTKDK